MKECKYQVWDVSKEKMFPVASINFGDDGSALTISIAPAPVDHDNHRDLVEGEGGFLREYIGSKDKKDKEIFDGDILMYEDERGAKRFWEVVWDEGRARWLAKRGDSSEIINWGTREVVGNKYEDPEILSPKKEKHA